MSSTNRNATRQPDDFYETPAGAVDAVIPWVRHILDNPKARILEPGCGRGAIIKRLLAYGVAPHQIMGVELDAQRAQECREATSIVVWRGSFLDDAWSPERRKTRIPLVMGNPPYELAMEFVERSVAIADNVCLLLRQGFSASKKRAPFHLAHPSDMRLLPERPSFTEHLHWKFGWAKESGLPPPPRCPLRVEQPKKPFEKWPQCQRREEHPDVCMQIGTDSCEYAWFVFGPGDRGRWSPLVMP